MLPQFYFGNLLSNFQFFWKELAATHISCWDKWFEAPFSFSRVNQVCNYLKSTNRWKRRTDRDGATQGAHRAPCDGHVPPEHSNSLLLYTLCEVLAPGRSPTRTNPTTSRHCPHQSIPNPVTTMEAEHITYIHSGEDFLITQLYWGSLMNWSQKALQQLILTPQSSLNCMVWGSPSKNSEPSRFSHTQFMIRQQKSQPGHLPNPIDTHFPAGALPCPSIPHAALTACGFNPICSTWSARASCLCFQQISQRFWGKAQQKTGHLSKHTTIFNKSLYLL